MKKQMYDLSDYRKNYKGKIIQPTETPFQLFEQWFEEANKKEKYEVNAMVLATIDRENRPQARMVLLKSFSEEGFLFFTNYLSNKGKEIEIHPVVSLLFFWQRLQRQVRITGSIRKVSSAISDNYFYSRPKESQHAAIVSKQSSLLPNRNVLLKAFRESLKQSIIERPKHWGGYCVKPTYFEFWQGMPNRLHDRLIYEYHDNCWKVYRLYP